MSHFPLFETVLIENGEIRNLFFHQQRLEKAFAHFFKNKTACLLNEIIQIPREYMKGKVRCRVDYNADDYQVLFSFYESAKIEKFEFFYAEKLDYSFKYTEREIFNRLNVNQIIVNNGFISDTPIANLLFKQGEQWFSPKHYLLKGTQLSYLLQQGKVELKAIRPCDLNNYEKIMWINALNPFDETRAIQIKN